MFCRQHETCKFDALRVISLVIISINEAGISKMVCLLSLCMIIKTSLILSFLIFW